MATVARRALKLMHYQEPYRPNEISEVDGACVAGCYRCILSYYNQPDQELIDRRDPAVVEFLCELATAGEPKGEPDAADQPWVRAVELWGLPKPTILMLADVEYPLYWPARDVLAVIGDPSAELAAQAASRGILEVITLPQSPSATIPANLLSALGVS